MYIILLNLKMESNNSVSFYFSTQNIDFMPTILSRFDMIFVVKDEHDEARDTVSTLESFQNLKKKKNVQNITCLYNF